MTDFSQVIEAQLAGATVRAAWLVRFDFRSGALRLWEGFGDLDAGGERWLGAAGLGAMSPIQAGPGQVVEEMTFELAGTEALVASFAADSQEATGRDVEVYLQFFDIRSETDWQPLDDPFSLFWGVMGPMKISRPVTDAGERPQRVISVVASNAFINRSKPPHSFYSQTDQQARSSSDNIFLAVSHLADRKVRWPGNFTG